MQPAGMTVNGMSARWRSITGNRATSAWPSVSRVNMREGTSGIRSISGTSSSPASSGLALKNDTTATRCRCIFRPTDQRCGDRKRYGDFHEWFISAAL